MIREIGYSLTIKLLLPFIVKGGNYYPLTGSTIAPSVQRQRGDVHTASGIHQGEAQDLFIPFTWGWGGSDCRLKAITMHNTPTISSHLGTLCQKVLQCSEKIPQTVFKNFLCFLLLPPPSTSKHSPALRWPTGFNCNTLKAGTHLKLHLHHSNISSFLSYLHSFFPFPVLCPHYF